MIDLDKLSPVEALGWYTAAAPVVVVASSNDLTYLAFQLPPSKRIGSFSGLTQDQVRKGRPHASLSNSVVKGELKRRKRYRPVGYYACPRFYGVSTWSFFASYLSNVTVNRLSPLVLKILMNAYFFLEIEELPLRQFDYGLTKIISYLGDAVEAQPKTCSS